MKGCLYSVSCKQETKNGVYTKKEREDGSLRDRERKQVKDTRKVGCKKKMRGKKLRDD